MFQYAFGRHLANKNATELKLDLSFYSDSTLKDPRLTRRYYNLDIFNIEAAIASDEEVALLSQRGRGGAVGRMLKKLIGKSSCLVMEPHYHFSQTMYDLPDGVYVSGYWQSPKYFADVELELRKEFTFRQKLEPNSEELRLRLREANSVCVNVRRGDFVGNSLHDAFGVDYYYKALSIVAERLRDFRIFVFSDDIEWCRENLKFDEPAEYVSHEHLGNKYQDYIRLIASCRHFIIPNSSFSWWAVWLNEDGDKIVIAPKDWVADPSWNTDDLYPADWIRI